MADQDQAKRILQSVSTIAEALDQKVAA
jgi:hypothetical protein